jgi:hypothetical protein
MRRVLLVLALLAASLPAPAQLPQQEFQFDVPSGTEVFGGQKNEVVVRFTFYFPVDATRYLPVDRDMAQVLSSAPGVTAPKGIRARVVSSVCQPRDLVIAKSDRIVEVSGAQIVTKIELEPRQGFERSEQTIRVEYPLIESVFAMLGSIPPAEASTTFTVDVWPSAAAKQAVLAAEEEKLRQKREAEMRAREAARQVAIANAARVQRENEAAERARREERARLLRKMQPYAAAVLVLFLIFLIYRKWLYPDMEVVLTSGGHVQHTLPEATIAEAEAEPGTITQTAWAKNRLWLRKRIKLETFVSDTSAGRGAHRIDLLVSVGKSVRPGRYLAAVHDAAVRVTIRPD